MSTWAGPSRHMISTASRSLRKQPALMVSSTWRDTESRGSPAPRRSTGPPPEPGSVMTAATPPWAYLVDPSDASALVTMAALSPASAASSAQVIPATPLPSTRTSHSWTTSKGGALPPPWRDEVEPDLYFRATDLLVVLTLREWLFVFGSDEGRGFPPAAVASRLGLMAVTTTDGDALHLPQVPLRRLTLTNISMLYPLSLSLSQPLSSTLPVLYSSDGKKKKKKKKSK
mmetsp:Transcript_393/g.1459  ORF Transcript_393/g.1459 Transcript_393/m.1459 type:complete len:229 (-) Transcript_393:18-704(-)